MTDPVAQVAGAIGALAGGATTGIAGTAFESVALLLKLALTPGGQEGLLRLLPPPERIREEQLRLDTALAAETKVFP